MCRKVAEEAEVWCTKSGEWRAASRTGHVLNIAVFIRHFQGIDDNAKRGKVET